VIIAFEELKPMFIENAGPIPSHFSIDSELASHAQLWFLPTLRVVTNDTGTCQSNDLKEDLNPQLACIVKGRGRVFIYRSDNVCFCL